MTPGAPGEPGDVQAVPNLLFVCTGNAARSVMAVTMARARTGSSAAVRGAGTLSIPGLPMSQRTRQALAALGLADPEHRSRQLHHDDTTWADLIVTFEPQHVAYVRRHHPAAAARTATLPRLVRHLEPDGPLVDRVRALDLAGVTIEPWEEVVDPAGGDQAAFDRCAAEIAGLLDRFLTLVVGPPGSGAVQ